MTTNQSPDQGQFENQQKDQGKKESKRNKKPILTRIIENRILKFVFISFISIILGIAGIYAIFKLFPHFSQVIWGKLDWAMLGEFSGVISLGLLFGGLVFAGLEYFSKEQAKADEKNKLSYEIYQAIFEKLTDPEQEVARRWILAEIDEKGKGEDLASWYEKTNQKIMANAVGNDIPEGQKSIKLTLNCFDYIGFIADHFWDADEDSLDWISAPIAKVWKRIGPYVERVGELRGVEDYYTSAQSIGNRCIDWRKKRDWDKEKFPENSV